MPRRSCFLFLAFVAVLRASVPPPAAATAFTAKELAQGYRDHVVLAQPFDSQAASIDAAEAREGVRVRRRFAHLHDLRVIDLDAGDTTAHAVARLRATGRYRFVEPDYIRHVAIEPNDPAYTAGSMWDLKNTGANDGVAGADIHAPAAWDVIHDAPNVVVAIVDTGVRATHQDLSPNLWTNPSPTVSDLHGANFVGGNGSIVNGNPADDDGHGTHVAGTIGAVGNNSIGIPGIAWKVQLMAVKVLDSSGDGAVSDIVAGIKYAVDHGANIINASYGAAGTGYSDTELAAITYARDHGVVFVAAAGNDTANMDISRFYPASFPLDNIVTVGASDYRDQPAYYSNYGAAVDLFAPGDNITSLDYNSNTGTAVLSGTSMAAPHVSGALALLKAKFPGDTYRQLINRLLRGTEPSVNSTSTFTGKAQTGGRLNLLAALTATTNRPFNDDFATRPRFAVPNLAIRASNAGASAEPGEPAHAGSTANASLWWEWTAPTSGAVSVDTTGSDYDTVLAVYTGASLATLQPVASNDDSDGTTSRVTFNAVAGTAYEIAVDGKAQATGLTLLNLGTTPANDAFAAAQVLTGTPTNASVRADGSTAHCTREPGEPRIDPYLGGTSLWYRWTAPHSGHFQAAVVTADFDPLVRVFTGSSLDSLQAVATNIGNATQGALCGFDATAGTTYSIMVDAKVSSSVGEFILTLVDSQWQARTGGNITGSPAIGADGHVYIGGTDGVFYAFDTDGTQLWTYSTNGLIDTCSPLITTDGTICIGSNDGTLYALNPSGTLKWKHAFGTSTPVSNSPALAADGTIYVKAGDGYLYALNPADGSTKWSHNVNGPLSYASPSVAPDGTIYQGVEGGALYALNPSDGSQKWRFGTATGDDVYSVAAIDAAGNLYFSAIGSGKLYSLTPAGAQRWVFAPAAPLASSSSPALSADGATAYYAGYDAKLYAVNTATGALRWSCTLGDQVRASSPAVDANGVVYIGCYDDRLYAINADGTLNRVWDTANWIRSSPLISGHLLYVGSNDGKLYAFDLGTSFAAGPWPQYRQNVRRTGRALSAPVFTAQPASQTVAAGSSVTLSASATSTATVTYQWQLNGNDLPGATGASLTVSNLQSADAGIYTVAATGDASVTSSPAIVGVTTDQKVIGAATALEPHDIKHPNGNIYDQVLLTGAAASITADPGQATRLSYIDLNDDIVQVEFTGHGTLSLALDDASGPAAPALYNQPGISYMKGHAHIVIAGADETTNVSVFSVGRLTAFDPTGAFNFLLPVSDANNPANNGNPLFTGHPVSSYDAFADIASIAIASADGKFGGVRIADSHCWSDAGLTGIYAPGVQFAGPVYVGNISAYDTAAPVLLLGAASDVRITGGDLSQPNGAAVQVAGITQLRFTAGTDSQGHVLPAQSNHALLEENGADVTSKIVGGTGP
ncbi:MAG TPA: S8 family serine peptidase [Opitutus sp.]|nr:S8 family serine peptidase [Opitutus sp.]